MKVRELIEMLESLHQPEFEFYITDYDGTYATETNVGNIELVELHDNSRAFALKIDKHANSWEIKQDNS